MPRPRITAAPQKIVGSVRVKEHIMQVIATEAAIRRAHPFSSLASSICAVSSQVNSATKSTLMSAPFVLPFDSPHLISFVVVLVCSANHVRMGSTPSSKPAKPLFKAMCCCERLLLVCTHCTKWFHAHHYMCSLASPGYLSRLHAMYPDISLTLVTPMLTGSCKEGKHHVLHWTLSLLLGYQVLADISPNFYPVFSAVLEVPRKV